MMRSLPTLVIAWMAGLSMAGGQTFKLEKQGTLYSLQARDANVNEILAEIDARERVPLQIFGDYDKPFTAELENMPLDELLYKLGVSYVLLYEADQHGEYQLSEAMMLTSDAPPVEPEEESYHVVVEDDSPEFIRSLIRDLRHDNIPFNALIAYNKLSRLGCRAAPYLEQALTDSDRQARFSVAQLLNSFVCETHPVSEQLIQVSMEMIRLDHDEYDALSSHLGSSAAFNMLNRHDVYPRVRSRILSNLYSLNRRERLCAALMATSHGETGNAGEIVRILAPHLADNDLPNDANYASLGLYQLGPAVLPYLQPYRFSKDTQQAELVELICTALETGEIPAFTPVMFAGYPITPITGDMDWINVSAWHSDRFPDDLGNYSNLRQPRMTTRDYYAPWHDNEPHTEYPQPEYAHGELEEEDPAGIVYLYDTGWYSALSRAGEPPFPYSVKKGDTLASVSEKFSVSPEDIRAVNAYLGDQNELPPGAKMLIPWE